MRLRNQYRRKKCITDYANANCFTNADVVNLMNNKQLFYHEQGHVLVPINETRMTNVQTTSERYDKYKIWVKLGCPVS